MDTTELARQIDQHLFIAENEVANTTHLMAKEGCYPPEISYLYAAQKMIMEARQSLLKRMREITLVISAPTPLDNGPEGQGKEG